MFLRIAPTTNGLTSNVSYFTIILSRPPSPLAALLIESLGILP